MCFLPYIFLSHKALHSTESSEQMKTNLLFIQCQSLCWDPILVPLSSAKLCRWGTQTKTWAICSGLLFQQPGVEQGILCLGASSSVMKHAERCIWSRILLPKQLNFCMFIVKDTNYMPIPSRSLTLQKGI